jgi:hypothetical protein
MSPPDFETLFGSDSAFVLPRLSELFVRMALATALGAFVAFRVWRKFLPLGNLPAPEGAESQTLIAAAGAVMVLVIGDSPARAFGLVGLGSFIRFRSGIRDPRDAAVMFVMIGIGMACGLGLPAMAAGATLLICLILIVFDMLAGRTLRRTTVMINAEDPALVRTHVDALFRGVRVVEVGVTTPALGKENGRLVVELNLSGDTDAAKIQTILNTAQVPGIRRVAIVKDD